MAAIQNIAHAAFPDAPARQRGERAAILFGGAVTHSELVAAKLRVDPVSLAEKKRQVDPARKREEPPRESNRAQRYGEKNADDDKPGSRIDIRV